MRIIVDHQPACRTPTRLVALCRVGAELDVAYMLGAMFTPPPA